MKLKEMKPHVYYVVATNGTIFKPGDRIYLDPTDNCIITGEGEFYTPEEWCNLRNEVYVDKLYYRTQIKNLVNSMLIAEYSLDEVKETFENVLEYAKENLSKEID